MGEKKINGNGAATPGQEKTPLVLSLPDTLIQWIAQQNQQLHERQMRLQMETENAIRNRLEGFMAAFPQTAGKNFNLSDDKTCLIEVS